MGIVPNWLKLFSRYSNLLAKGVRRGLCVIEHGIANAVRYWVNYEGYPAKQICCWLGLPYSYGGCYGAGTILSFMESSIYFSVCHLENGEVLLGSREVLP